MNFRLNPSNGGLSLLAEVCEAIPGEPAMRLNINDGGKKRKGDACHQKPGA